ncbi:MAG: hypothetical protein EXS22_02785 [Pedosphaera sp.]|nr:hypothetical protein [Pedosphaera sp.]MSU42951.1 hypothetical protein [Pedosphaera sp.]
MAQPLWRRWQRGGAAQPNRVDPPDDPAGNRPRPAPLHRIQAQPALSHPAEAGCQFFQETKLESLSQYLLGKMYHEGQRVPQNHVEAAQWYRKAAEQLAQAQKRAATLRAMIDAHLKQ